MNFVLLNSIESTRVNMIFLHKCKVNDRQKEHFAALKQVNQVSQIHLFKSYFRVVYIRVEFFDVNPLAAGAGDLRELQAVTKTLHLVLKLFFSEFGFKK